MAENLFAQHLDVAKTSMLAIALAAIVAVMAVLISTYRRCLVSLSGRPIGRDGSKAIHTAPEYSRLNYLRS